MHSTFKNQTIQQNCSNNPRASNRFLKRATFKPAPGSYNNGIGMNQLSSHQPHIARTHLASEGLNLTKLYQELYSPNQTVALQAINCVCDLVRDPEKILQIIKFQFINRLSHMLLRIDNEDFRERILHALFTVASQAAGRQEIASRPILIEALKEFLRFENSFNIRFKTASVIEMFSRSFLSSSHMIQKDFIPPLITFAIFEQHQIVFLHLCSLESLLHHVIGQECAIKCDSYQKLLYLLDIENILIVSKALKCLALLTSHPQGILLAREFNILYKMNELVRNQNRNVYTAAAEVIMFATSTVATKHTAASIDGLSVRLLDLCHDNFPPVQMFAMKALSNMVDNVDVRLTLEIHHLDKVESILTYDIKDLQIQKDILIKLIKWKPWIG